MDSVERPTTIKFTTTAEFTPEEWAEYKEALHFRYENPQQGKLEHPSRDVEEAVGLVLELLHWTHIDERLYDLEENGDEDDDEQGVADRIAYCRYVRGQVNDFLKKHGLEECVDC